MPSRILPKLAAAACGAATLAASPAEPAAPFAPPAVVTLGGSRRPSALAAGDFDRDGKIDLAVASDSTQDLVVLLGDGRGRFRARPPAPAGAHPTEIAVADFDRDGRPDLAIANHEMDYVTVLLGVAGGDFRPAPGSPIRVASRPHPHTIAAADLDGDGRLDLLLDSWQENRLLWLRGDGRGGFGGPGVPIEVGRKPYRNAILADLDGDGRLDIATPNLAERTVTLLFGGPGGSFRGAASPPRPAGPSPFVVRCADLNRDGLLDLVVANYSGQLSDPSADALTFLLADGRGGFRPGPRLTAGRAPFDVAVGDVDGDGYADAVTANGGSRDLTLALGGADGFSASRLRTIAVGRSATRVLLADFDGDGRADAVASNEEEGSVSVFLTRR